MTAMETRKPDPPPPKIDQSACMLDQTGLHLEPDIVSVRCALPVEMPSERKSTHNGTSRSSDEPEQLATCTLQALRD